MIGNQHHKTLVKMRKSPMRELFARFEKGLGTGFAGQIGLIGEMGKKCLQFSLNAGIKTRHHGNLYDGKDQNALVNQCGGLVV